MLLEKIHPVAFHERLAYEEDDITRLDSLLICPEKPDVRRVTKILERIASLAPKSLARNLLDLTELAGTIDQGAFYARLAEISERIKIAPNAWSPDPADQAKLANTHLMDNDGVSARMSWQHNFIRQVENIRLCHLRQIAKKGNDLHGMRHFDANQRPQDDPATRGRISAALEVLETVSVRDQARRLLAETRKKKKLRTDAQGQLVIHMVRPVKDYSRRENSINLLTITHARMLAQALREEGEKLFPGARVEIVDQPVVMKTVTNRTDATPFERLLKQPLFDVPDLTGENVVLTDDHANAGAFLITLSSCLREMAANVIGVATFSRHPHMRDLRVAPEIIEAMQRHASCEEWNEALGKVGLSLETLSNREAFTFLALMMDGAQKEDLQIFRTLENILANGDHILPGQGDDLGTLLAEPPLDLPALEKRMERALSTGKIRCMI